MRLEQHILKHQGFTLTPLTASDRMLYLRLFNDPLVMHYIAPPLGIETADLLFQQALKPKLGSDYYYWSVSGADGAALGIAALITQQPGIAEFGLMLLPEFCFKGYSVPVLSGLINFGFQQWKLDKVVAKHQSNNLAAPGLLRRLSVQRVKEDGVYWFWQLDRKYWATLNKQPPYLTTNGS